jgi:hypothetical protein
VFKSTQDETRRDQPTGGVFAVCCAPWELARQARRCAGVVPHMRPWRPWRLCSGSSDAGVYVLACMKKVRCCAVL